MKRKNLLGILVAVACVLPASAQGTKFNFEAALTGAGGGSLRGLAEELSASAFPEAVISAEPVSGDASAKGYIAGAPELPLEWVQIDGGSFTMGTDDMAPEFEASKPIHEVRIPPFEISRNLVTVGQYAQCVARGKCTLPGRDPGCNWGSTARINHPINCVSFKQANEYAAFAMARLPSESEWEYAATGLGQSQLYPWGNEAPDGTRVVISTFSTLPVCSRPAGRTAQGVCDMSGHLYQWTADYANTSYKWAPTDGKPDTWNDSYSDMYRVIRGGSFGSNPTALRADYRAKMMNADGKPGFSTHAGIRLARSVNFRWVAIPGGSFTMGRTNLPDGSTAATPVHQAAVKDFELGRAPVTVKEYGDCVASGKCTRPGTGSKCNWGVANNANHPVNCVTWEQASQYAVFAGARLPTEAEWEYAARNGGDYNLYPWGGTAPTSSLAVMEAAGTEPVCSRPAGNTRQGVCDMAGNVFQWVQDVFAVSYAGAPADGSAYNGPGNGRVIRGSPFNELPGNPDNNNYTRGPGFNSERVGFRLARSR